MPSVDHLYDEINRLPIDDRVALVQRLLGKQAGLTVILGSNNFTSNHFAIQLNGDSHDLSEKLKDIPPETIAKLLEAIAARIERDG